MARFWLLVQDSHDRWEVLHNTRPVKDLLSQQQAMAYAAEHMVEGEKILLREADGYTVDVTRRAQRRRRR